MNELTEVEQSDLKRCEGIIESGLQTFVEVGQALLLIRDGKLYRASHGTFAAYCEDRFKISKSRAYQLIDAATVSENVHHGGQNEIPNERQARELAKLPEEQQAEVWEDVTTTEEPVTASKVKQAVDEKLRTPEPTEPAPEKPHNDQLKIHRSKAVKTVEALMRAFDDLAMLSPDERFHDVMLTCKSLLETARGWK